MYVGKRSLQPALKRHMHGRRGCNIPRPARVDVMVERDNVENARLLLVNYSGFFSRFFPGFFLGET